MCMLVLQLAQQQANLEETNAKKQSELIGANCLPPLLCYVRLTRALVGFFTTLGVVPLSTLSDSQKAYELAR